jgi:FAD/FMN-containing dehydrogenase
MSKKVLSRRTFVAGTAAVSGLAIMATLAGCDQVAPGSAWPGMDKWEELNAQVGGRLIKNPTAPWAAIGPGEIPQDLTNPWFLEEQPGATQSTGMYKAWVSEPSSYAVAAETVEDVVAAVNFAREHNVKLVVKGTGHDYYGRSCAPNSLLIWTHNMRAITVHSSFHPDGAPSTVPGIPALSTSAGNRWLEAYKAATDAGVFIQGGGCTSVGACGGFALGGGFGSFSKKFGSGAAGVVELEVVTASGEVLIANKYQNPDLFWALRGGGGGTFGVVTRMTLMSHPIPSIDGWVSGTISASSDEAYVVLIEKYLRFIDSALTNEVWGEGVTFVKGENTIDVGTSFLDISSTEATAIWEELLAPLRAQPEDFTVNVKFTEQPFAAKWNPAGKSGAIMDDRPEALDGYFWWKGNAVEVGAYWGGYQGHGIPREALQGSTVSELAQAFFNATRTSLVLLQTNKALAGEPEEARKRDETTSINPAVFNNAAFVTLGDWVQYKYVGVAGHEPDEAVAQDQFDGVNTAMEFIKKVTPTGGSYTNEGYYFEKAWQSEFWGENYSKLLKVKQQYDPTNLFTVHHGVGSEGEAHGNS